MIDPTKVTNFARNKRELEIFWVFCLFVAGKNSDIAANKINQLVHSIPGDCTLFDYFRNNGVRNTLEQIKIGQYNRLTKAIEQSLNIDLFVATLNELLNIHGVGPKTARFFIVHSRKGAKYAVLDTHILKYINALELWDNVPAQTPNKTQYPIWEQRFIDICYKYYPNMSIAEIDLMIWKMVSGRNAA